MGNTYYKDKNGVEIIEGDILSLNGETDYETTCCGVIIKYKGRHVSSYGQDCLGRDCFDELSDVNKDREIIGNIYKTVRLRNKVNF